MTEGPPLGIPHVTETDAGEIEYVEMEDGRLVNRRLRRFVRIHPCDQTPVEIALYGERGWRIEGWAEIPF